MNELIKVNYDNDRQTTSARTLWEFLEKPWGEFLKWFNQFKDYGFVENIDYRVIEQLSENPKGGRPSTDYEITVEMAKELAMLQKTDKGKQARLYFIELEKQWNSPEAVYSRALKMADKKMLELKNTNNILMLENAKKEQIINELQPKASYYDLILQSKDKMAVTKIAKDYGMSAQSFNDLLNSLGVQYKLDDTWLLYQQYADKGYTLSNTYGFTHSNGELGSRIHTYWTQKGRLFIYELLKRNNILPLIEKEAV